MTHLRDAAIEAATKALAEHTKPVTNRAGANTTRSPTMTDPAAVLAGCLPADPADQPKGIGVPTAAVRGVLAELLAYRNPPLNTGHGRQVTIAGPVIEHPPIPDGGE